jgi:hypothetical protein
MRSILALGVLLGIGFGLWSYVATQLDPLAEDTPGALLLFYGPMFASWGLVGFVATRRTGRVLDGVKAGAAVAFVTFVVLFLAVILRVNLFLETMTQRPDWQNMMARFQVSGFESLRAWSTTITWSELLSRASSRQCSVPAPVWLAGSSAASGAAR